MSEYQSKAEWPEPQLTKEQAIAIAESGEWEEWTDEYIVSFQLFQQRLCMNFGRFHEAVKKVLDRPIWTHEFAYIENLQQEYRKEKETPDMVEILNLIPAEKLLVIGGSGKELTDELFGEE